MEKIQAINRISQILETKLKITDDLDTIAKDIYEDLQQNNVIGNGFIKRFSVETNTDDNSIDLPNSLFITTPMFKGQVFLRSNMGKYWYENGEGGTVLAMASKKIMLTKIKKYA